MSFIAATVSLSSSSLSLTSSSLFSGLLVIMSRSWYHNSIVFTTNHQNQWSWDTETLQRYLYFLSDSWTLDSSWAPLFNCHKSECCAAARTVTCDPVKMSQSKVKLCLYSLLLVNEVGTQHIFIDIKHFFIKLKKSQFTIYVFTYFSFSTVWFEKNFVLPNFAIKLCISAMCCWSTWCEGRG